MDDRLKPPIRHNGTVTSILEDKVSQDKRPVVQQEPAPVPGPQPNDPPTPAVAATGTGRDGAAPALAGNAEDSASAAAWKRDDSMNPNQRPGMPGPIDERMRAFIGHAGRSWPKLSGDELLQTSGYSHNLSFLIQRRYGMLRQQAEMQVREFFELHPM